MFQCSMHVHVTWHLTLSWKWTFKQKNDVNSETRVNISLLVEIMDDRAGWGVQLPLHQPVLRSQLQHFVTLKDVFERRPAVALFCSEYHRQFKGRGDAGVDGEAPHRLQALLALHVHLDGGAPEAAGLIRGGAHHVLPHPGCHVMRQQQHLAEEGGGFGFSEAELNVPGHSLLQDTLLLLHTGIHLGNCRKRSEYC